MIKNYRIVNKLTQKQLGERVGLSERTIRWYEYCEKRDRILKSANYKFVIRHIAMQGLLKKHVQVYENNQKLVPETKPIEIEEPVKKINWIKWIAFVLIVVFLVVLW